MATRIVEFTTGGLDEVCAVMAEMADRRRPFMNVRPAVDEERIPKPMAGILGLFSNRVPVLPVGTWVPAPDGKGPTSLGVQHPTGRKVGKELGEAGLRPDPTWKGIQDHPKRGLVLEIPADTAPTAVLAWLLPVMIHLSPITLDGEWRATFDHL